LRTFSGKEGVDIQVFRIHFMSPSSFQKHSVWDVAYGLALALASVMAYEASSVITPLFLHAPADAVDKLWAVISAVFVFRDTRANSLSVGTSRLIATFVSFLLCLIYLSCLPAHPLGMTALIAIGTPIMMLLERRSDVGLTAITTAVVMIVATSKPESAWQQPCLRLMGTTTGIAVGIAFKWVTSFLFYRVTGEEVR